MHGALTNGRWRCHSRPDRKASLNAQSVQKSADNSPSPGGEGRGEGGLFAAEARGSNQSVHGEGESFGRGRSTGSQRFPYSFLTSSSASSSLHFTGGILLNLPIKAHFIPKNRLEFTVYSPIHTYFVNSQILDQTIITFEPQRGRRSDAAAGRAK